LPAVPHLFGTDPSTAAFPRQCSTTEENCHAEDLDGGRRARRVFSRAAAEALAQSRTLTGAAIGAGAGAVVAGPPGAVVGGVVGAAVGGPKLPRSRPASCHRDSRGVRHCR
jgi:hypothetical protein